MMHPTSEELNGYCDGALAAARQAEVGRHVETCADCALVVAELQHLVREAASLVLVDPPPAVWTRLQQAVAAQPPQRRWQTQRGPVWALATAALIILAFLTGRLVEHRAARDTVAARVEAPPSTNQTRERVLLVAVGDHLERSQMVLVELANAETHDALDISAERQSADELLASNRLYRQTATQLGQTGVADLLDDLERVLVEVARGPSQVSMQQLADLQQRIESQGILFKVKVIRNNTAYR